ncbi:MAG: substrate-binding domain-containing protein [Pseudorhodoplanes sp.]|nr:substrate-binding domain-containing protein [Pseudorhodoplanes sp.]
MTMAPAFGQTLTIVGTGDGVDMLRALAASFMRNNPQAKVFVPPSIGSTAGIEAVARGEAVLGRVARILTDAEAAAGINYEPFAILPSAFYVHPSAGVTGLTNGQLADIYAGRITNWSRVGGADLRVRVVAREEGDSTLTVLRATMPRWRDLVITDRANTALTTQEAMESVRNTPGAIGFGPFTRTLERRYTVLRIDGHHPTDAGYPSRVNLALIWREATVTPLARAFLTFVTSQQASQVIESFGTTSIKRPREGS